jgi:uncharacterized membrane protein
VSASRWSLAAALFVAAGLRLFRLGHQSLWIDEIFSWYSAEIGQRWTTGHLLEDVHGPLYSLLLHLWGGFAGDSEWALRLPSALLGVALVAAIAWLSGLWLGRETVVPAAWLAAGSPFLVWYAQEARNYTLLMLCVCISSALLLGLRERFRAPGVIGYLVAAGAGLLSNLSFAFVAPVHVRWWMGLPGARWRRLALAAVAAAVLLVLASPWVPQIGRIWDWRRLLPQHVATATETPLRGSTTFHVAALPFAAYSFAVGYTLGPPVRELRASASTATLRRYAGWIAAAALVFGILGLFGARALTRRRRWTEALLWVVLPAAIVSYFALQNFKVFHPRYLAMAMPAFLALLAAAFADLRGAARLGLAAAVAGLWALSLGHHYFDPRFGKEDMRGAAAQIAAHAVPGERIVAANCEDPLFYYYRGPVPVVTYWLGWSADPGRLASRFEEIAGPAAAVWVVESRGEDLDPTGAFDRYLDTRYPGAERSRFEGVKVWHIRRPQVKEGPPARS